jgi:hypothetical protein
MKSPAWPLQTAIHSRIRATTGYTIYDNDPVDAKFPYLKIGEFDAQDWSDKSKPGQVVFATFHFWSKYPGKKEAAEMMGAVLQALTESWSPDLQPVFNVVLQTLEMNNIITDIDGKTRHGILKLKYLIEEL